MFPYHYISNDALLGITTGKTYQDKWIKELHVTEDAAAPDGTETGNKEAIGIEDDTGTDESTPAQTEKKGITIFFL